MTNSMGEEIKSGKKYVFGRFWDYIRNHEWVFGLSISLFGVSIK